MLQRELFPLKKPLLSASKINYNVKQALRSLPLRGLYHSADLCGQDSNNSSTSYNGESPKYSGMNTHFSYLPQHHRNQMSLRFLSQMTLQLLHFYLERATLVVLQHFVPLVLPVQLERLLRFVAWHQVEEKLVQL